MTSQAISADDASDGVAVADHTGERPTQARALRSARVSRHMTQETLASAAGVSSRTVIRAERGDEITVENLRAICSVLDLDARDWTGPGRPTASECVSAGTGPGQGISRAPSTPSPIGRLGRLLTRRRVIASLAAPFLVYAFTDYASSRVFSALHVTDVVDSQMSSLRATVVAARVNLVLGKLSRGEAPAASDMGPNWDFVSNWCGSTGFADRTEKCGRSTDMRMVIRVLNGEGLDFVIGRIDDAFLEALALQLAAPPGVSLKVATAPDEGTPTPGALWFDPRGVDPRNLPRVTARTPYLSVRINRTGDDR